MFYSESDATFQLSSRAGFCQRMFEIASLESSMVYTGIYSNNMKPPSPEYYMTFWSILHCSNILHWSDITQTCHRTMFIYPYIRCCIADLPPCRSPPRSEILQTFPRKICNIADPPQGGRFATLQIFPLSLQIFPGGGSATLQTSPHFCKVPDSNLRIYRKKGF